MGKGRRKRAQRAVQVQAQPVQVLAEPPPTFQQLFVLALLRNMPWCDNPWYYVRKVGLA